MKTNQVKQFGRLRTFRMRVLNDNYTIAPINNWDRTVCASDIKKFLECEALYLQWKEGDATGEQSITEQVGDIVHEETAKPEGQRINDLASRITTVTDKVERERVVAEVKKLIEVSTAAQKADSKGAKVSKKEETLVYFDDYTQTWWYAKLDSTDLKSNDRGAYLNVIDQKAGRYRSAMQLTSVFFQAYVAKMSKAFGHEGPIRYAVRYLRDRFGNILNTPEEKPYWLGRRLNESQDQALYEMCIRDRLECSRLGLKSDVHLALAFGDSQDARFCFDGHRREFAGTAEPTVQSSLRRVRHLIGAHVHLQLDGKQAQRTQFVGQTFGTEESRDGGFVLDRKRGLVTLQPLGGEQGDTGAGAQGFRLFVQIGDDHVHDVFQFK